MQISGCPGWQGLRPAPLVGWSSGSCSSCLIRSQVIQGLQVSHGLCALPAKVISVGRFGRRSRGARSGIRLSFTSQGRSLQNGFLGRLILHRTPEPGDRRRLAFKCRADSNGGLTSGLNLVNRIETDSLPPSLRDSCMQAIDDLGRRVTVGDVAARTGLKVTQAQSALQALAADSGGFLEVSDEGDVLYCFPREYRSNLTAKSLKIRLEPTFQKVQEVGSYLVRVTFGTTLLASIVLVYSAIVVLISSARSDEDSRSNRGYGAQRSSGPGFTMFISPADLFWYWDPYYYRRRRTRTNGGFNFFESVFSFVFGDEDPNEGLEDQRWRAIGDLITTKGGVVTAEELAPFLNVPPLRNDNESDESYVLPVLLRFDGQPEVDDKGNILYRFPSLQRSGVDWLGRRAQQKIVGYFAEKRLNFSKANAMERAMVIGLGGVNMLGVIILSSMLKDYTLMGHLGGASGFIPFVSKILPLLQVYTAAFFAIPAFRWVVLQQKNLQIEERNRARMERAITLDRADPALLKKIKSARESANRTVINKERIVYSTEKDFSEQDYEAQEWERQLRERQAQQATQVRKAESS